MKYLTPILVFTLMSALTGCTNKAHSPKETASKPISSTRNHTSSQTSGTTRFVVGNLCNTDVRISLVTLKLDKEPVSVNFGITPDKMLGFSVISDKSEKSEIDRHSIAPYQNITLKTVPSTELANNPFNWFKKFRVKAKQGYQLGDAHDPTQWLRNRHSNHVTYTFFACKP